MSTATAAGSPVEKVLERLEGVKKNGTGWMAKCCGHPDDTASLSITEGADGRALLCCYAGCNVGDIVAAIDLSLSDLFPPKEERATNGHPATPPVWTDREGGKHAVVDRYTYTDEAGKPLTVTGRTADKQFPVWNVAERRWRQGSAPRVLYRLPKVLRAAAAGAIVFVVEGEKDVHSLESWGMVATTSPGGGGARWRAEYSQVLKGTRVVVLPDNDGTGRKHAADVLASLKAAGVTAAIVEIPGLPEAGDVSDAIAAGMTQRDLLNMAEGALEQAAAPASPPASPIDSPIDWAKFWDRDPSDIQWAYEDVLARGRGHALYAAHKDGKSLLMLYVAAQIATAEEPAVVIYLDWEQTPDDVYERLEHMGFGPTTDLSRLLYYLLPTLPPLDSRAGAERLMQILDVAQAKWPEYHPVVIIDTISRAVEGPENDADTFRNFYNHTGIELKRRGCTWVRLDHAGKDSGQGQRGSSSKGDDVDVVWRLSKTQNGVRLDRDLARMYWVPERVVFRLDEEPTLHYVRATDDYPAGTGEIANLLDRCEVPLNASSRQAAEALKSINEGRRTDKVCAALRWRRERQANQL